MTSKSAGEVVRLLLVDDHTLFRESLRRLLESEANVRISGDFANAEDALAAVHGGLEFDAALVDYDLQGTILGTGLDLVRKIRAVRPEARILMVTAGMGAGDLMRAVTDLNTGIFLKTEPTVELMLAIRRTAQGERWISSRASLALLASGGLPSARERPMAEQLSVRESRVLRGVLEGQSNKEIGAQLEMTESSVKAVLQKLFERAGVRSRSQLVRYAIETQIEPR
ncbi:MAG: response regulator transcription factor [Acidobacteriaceae bacterium]